MPHQTEVEAVSLLKEDHRRLQALLNRLNSVKPRALSEREIRTRELISVLSVHLHLKEVHFYPMLRLRAPDSEARVLEALEAHHLLKWQLKELDGRSSDDPRFQAKISQLTTVLRAHLAQETKHLHPQAYEHLTIEERTLLGQQMEQARRTAPTRPHPRLSLEPPFHLVQQRLLGVVDRSRDLLRGLRDDWTLARALRI